MCVCSDPGAPDSAAAKGMISLSFGKLFEKVSCLLPRSPVIAYAL